MIGRTIHQYRIMSELGAGGMGVIYKAEDTRSGRIVALAFLPEGVAPGDSARKRFKRDLEAIAALHHDNICAIDGIHQSDDGRWFVAMDYHDGETLRQRLARGPIGGDEAVGLIAQIADGLEQAHRADVVHGGIAPETIVVTPDGVAKILGFGCADVMPGGAMQSAGYQSPEQIRGEKADARSDIFAFGVLCDEMLRGASADALAPILHKMRATKPADRYADLAHVMRDLAQLRAPAPVEKTVRHQRNVTVALVVAIAVVAAVMLWLSFHKS